MLIASVISVIAFFGAFGPGAQAFSPFLAILIAFILSPVLAVLTKGKYYLARPDTLAEMPATKELRVLNCTVCTEWTSSQKQYKGVVC